VIVGATHHQTITNNVNHVYDQQFQYDDLNRLTQAVGSYGTST